MKQPKKIYLPDPENMLIWHESTNEVINRKFEYISVDQLKGWADKQAKLYHEDLGTLAILVKLLTFIESNE